ncbi:acyltransferase [Nocardioides jishulii]|uniref:Acyltransferase n=1 Tax=Nocardioides jishulii TaxID=2575440 RepID=A0A4U2YHN6_9ACTN|nr:acyltransferase [Nocardioides jishulii]QCX26650.1 acyltransferase [Nocardioides jishulii]TKI60380.1 acyltransferase [Nocardioides jishulii]
MRELRGPRRIAAESVFALRRAWYRVRFPGLTVGKDVRFVGRIRVRGGTKVVLGDRVRVRKLVRINGGGVVHVGPDTLLNGCWIMASTSVEIGARSLVSDAGILDTDYHNLDPERRHDPPTDRTRAPVVLGENVWLGSASMVLKGSTIGRDSVVAAGAVVRGEVPPRVVVSGNPATVVKKFADGPVTHRAEPHANEPQPSEPHRTDAPDTKDGTHG